METETRLLMCKLGFDEQRARGVELATEQHNHKELTEEKREIAARVKNSEAKIERLSDTVKYCQEERIVVCTLEPDFDADTMAIHRSDTADLVEIRQLTHPERQPALPGTEAPEYSDADGDLTGKKEGE